MKRNGNQSAAESNICVDGVSLDEDLTTSGKAIACLGPAFKEVVPVPKGSILQVQSVKNISVPKKSQDDFFVKYDPKAHMLKVIVTDGLTTGVGLLANSHPDFNDSTMPGSKIRLLEPITVVNGILPFSERNIQFLGGYVENLANQYTLQRSMELSRAWGMDIEQGSSSGEAPPPWRPFGQGVGLNKKELASFKAMDTVRNSQISAQGDEGPTQFETLRQEAIADLVKKTDTKKSFAEGKQLVNKDVVAITSEGFSEEEARITLRRFKNNRSAALKFLADRRDGVRPERRKLPVKKYGDDDSDPEPEVDPNHQPSKDITLFGFLKPAISKDQQKHDNGVDNLCKRDFPALSLSTPIASGQDVRKTSGFEDRKDFGARGDQGTGFSDRGRGFTDRGRGFSDRGRGFGDRGRGFSDRGRGFGDRGRGFTDRGRGGFSDRGRRDFGRDRSDGMGDGSGRGRGRSYSYANQLEPPAAEKPAVYEPYRGRVSDFPAMGMGEDLSSSERNTKNSYFSHSQQQHLSIHAGRPPSTSRQADASGSCGADREDRYSRKAYKSFDQQEKDRQMQYAKQATHEYLGRPAAAYSYSSGFGKGGSSNTFGASENRAQVNSVRQYTPHADAMNVMSQSRNPPSNDQVFSIPPFGENTRSDQTSWSDNQSREIWAPSAEIPFTSNTESTWGNNEGDLYSDEGYRSRADHSKRNLELFSQIVGESSAVRISKYIDPSVF